MYDVGVSLEDIFGHTCMTLVLKGLKVTVNKKLYEGIK